VDGSRRGGPGLPCPGNRTAQTEPTRPNRHGVRAFRPVYVIPPPCGAAPISSGRVAGPTPAAIPIAPVHPRFSFSIPNRGRAFCPSGDLGSSNRPFPGKCPQSNGSAREPSGPHVAGRREAALEPHRVYPPGRVPSSLGLGWMAQSAVVRDYRTLEIGRCRANRLVLTVAR
jgi:hypothetical protein